MPSDIEILQKQTKANTEAIASLTGLVGKISQDIAITSKDVERTSRDVDKISNYMEQLIPVNEMIHNIKEDIKIMQQEASQGIRPVTLKHLLIYATMILVSFGTWSTASYFALDKELSTHKVELDEKCKKINSDIKDHEKEIENNKNQITYNKGRISILQGNVK